MRVFGVQNTYAMNSDGWSMRIFSVLWTVVVRQLSFYVKVLSESFCASSFFPQLVLFRFDIKFLVSGQVEDENPEEMKEPADLHDPLSVAVVRCGFLDGRSSLSGGDLYRSASSSRSGGSHTAAGSRSGALLTLLFPCYSETRKNTKK